ncbi:hypothetical protein FACS1894190_04350 [Spirochaetia bacterium]|nr:hypothetical protein FACS1894190_04350 [Spirochaetia bacterium]
MKKFLLLGGVVTVIALAIFIGCSQPAGETDALDEDSGKLPALTGSVSITGEKAVGKKLTAKTSALGGSGAIAYKWTSSREGSAVIGTSPTYTVAEDDNNSVIRVTVSRAGYSGVKNASATIGTVEPTPVVTHAPDEPWLIGEQGPAGGTVFFVNDDPDTYRDWDYLEAAPHDVPGLFAWASDGYKDVHLDGEFSVDIGKGEANTTFILEADPDAPAAKAATGYELNGFTDWFLPSSGELNAMYENRAVINGDFADSFYWSSSQNQDANDEAWYQRFDNGDIYYYGNKYGTHYVRPVRAFLATPEPTDSPEPDPTVSPTPSSTSTAPPEPSPTPSSTPSGSPSASASPTPSGTPTTSATPTATPSGSPTTSASPSASASPTVTATPAVTATPTVTPTAMVAISTGTAINTPPVGQVFIAGRDSVATINAFKIAAYETTWSLWEEVRDWATSNGYTFANAGREGHGTDGTGAEGTDEERALRPVTMVSWRDAIVWCNAYSEMIGKEPVYYKGSDPTTILRNSNNSIDVDAATFNTSADGYRLPTEAEWEYAARGGVPGSTEWNYPYSGSETIDNVAWYWNNSSTPNLSTSDPDYGAHPVGKKAANGQGLFDMSGNVYEWCWDRHGTITATTPATGPDLGTQRVWRGGSWGSSDNYCEVANRLGNNPDHKSKNVGFRVVCPVE